jgi:outer membrane immunogenic protein
MKSVFASGVALLALALSSHPVFAADATDGMVDTPAPVVQPAFDWTSYYFGLQGGGGWGHVDWTYVPGGGTADHNTNGWLIGGTVGANWQAQGSSMVWGVEADAAWSNIGGSADCPNAAWTCTSELDGFGTLRARFGWAHTNWLFYGTGGLALGLQEARTSQGGNSFPDTNLLIGWTAGLGVEAAWSERWSGKAEWLYYDLGSDSFTVDNNLVVRARHNGNIFRVGINRRF